MRLGFTQQGLSLFPTTVAPSPPTPPAVAGPFVPVDVSTPIKPVNRALYPVIDYQRNLALLAPVAPVSGAIIWKPGHRIFPGGGGGTGGTSGNRNTPSLANAILAMDKVDAWDINNQIKGFLFPVYMADLEGPTAGNYSGNWGTDKGFNLVAGLINKAKSYNPPRDISFYINLTGNGGGGTTNANFPSYFVPSYLNSATYAGGCEWGGKAPYAGTTSSGLINGTIWNVNFLGRIAALIGAYYNQFGFDRPTGGIYLIDLFSEISFNAVSAANNSEFNASLRAQLPAIRAAAPKMMMSIRLSFGMKGSAADLVNCANAMFQSQIAMGNEDHTNMVLVPGAVLTAAQQRQYFAWGDQIYKGAYTGAPGATTDHSVLNDWAHVGNVEIAEYGIQSGATNITPVPPASKGSGYIYDNPSYPGIMSGTNFLKTAHVYWHVDEGQFGPNINNTTFFSNAPPNPTPGPGAGLTSARPHLGDVLTGNTAYPGITGPIPVPNVPYPTGWP